MTRSEGARRLSHARRLLAIQAAAGVVLGVVIVGAVTLAVVLSRQDADLRSKLEAATSSPDPGNPPPGIWIVIVDRHGTTSLSEHTPVGVPDESLVAEARSLHAPVVEEAQLDGRDYLTRTEMHGGTVVQAGIDFGRRDAERGRLLLGLGIAGAVAAGAAALLGVWLSRRAFAPLEEALARQRRFVADASHELRTPLSRITLRAQMLQRLARSGGPASEIDTDADLLVSEARDMAAIIEDLLLSARLEQSPFEGELVDLDWVAARVVDADRPRAEARRIDLGLHATQTNPVRGVAVALTRAVSALVDNALSHAPEGGHVEVRVEPGPHGKVLLSVADDGPGIDQSASERLFERFARGHREKGRFGLGLSLVREIIETHGGSIRLDPEYTTGARFVVSLPTVAPETAPDDTVSS